MSDAEAQRDEARREARRFIREGLTACETLRRERDEARAAFDALRAAVKPHLDYETEIRRLHGSMPSNLERTAVAAINTDPPWGGK